MMKKNNGKTRAQTFSFIEHLDSYIDDVFPEFYSESIFEKKKEKIDETNTKFDTLFEIYEERKKYNLHWAFKQASNLFKASAVRAEDKLLTEKEEYKACIIDLREKGITEIKRVSQFYSALNIINSVADIVVSVALILIVTLISQYGERLLESILLTILFIAVIALTKVMLDRFFIIPKLTKWGWRNYKKVTLFTMERVAIVLGVKMVIEEATRRGLTRPQKLNLIGQGIYESTLEKRFNKLNKELEMEKQKIEVQITTQT